ncbi:hypothetical protein D3C73_1565940 [compost metagenome]
MLTVLETPYIIPSCVGVPAPSETADCDTTVLPSLVKLLFNLILWFDDAYLYSK